MQETEMEPTETNFNTENTESSIKDNETQLEKEIDMQRLKKFNEYKEFIELQDKIKTLKDPKEINSYTERIQELLCNKAVMNYMLEILRTKTPLRHTFAPLPLYKGFNSIIAKERSPPLHMGA